MIAREVSGEQTHGYAVQLDQGQFLDLTVNQIGIDIAVTVLDPGGRALLRVDSPNGKEGVERVMVVAPETGNYYVSVSTGKALPGRYELKIDTIRQASEADLQRAAATRSLNQGQQLSTAGKALPAISAYRQALEAWRAAGEPAWEAETLDRIGQALEAVGRTAEAISEYRMAADIYRGLERHDDEANVLNRIARAHRTHGEFQKALEPYQLALKRYQISGNRRGQATTLNNMAVLYKSVGQTQKALELYNTALALWQALGDHARESITLMNVGELYTALGQFELALDALERALRFREHLTARQGAIALNNMGAAFRELGQLDQAIDAHRQALDIRRAAGDRRGEAINLNALGNTYYELKQPDAALDSYEQALKAFREVGDRQGTAYARLNLGWIYLDRGQPGRALSLFEQALPVFERINDPRGEASVLFSIARAKADQDDLQAARAYIEQSVDRVEALRRGSYSQADRSSYLATKHHYYELLVDVLMRLHEAEPEAGYAELALAENERSRSRSLLETLYESSADIRQGVDPSLIEREHTLQARLNQLEQFRLTLESSEPESDRIEALGEEIRHLVREYQELQAEIRLVSPKYAALTQPEPLAAREIQEVLDEDTLLLEYSLGDARSFLWLVSSSSIQSFVLPGREEIEGQARYVHELLRSSRQPDVTVQAELVTEALSQVLLGPVADQLGSKRLLVVTTGGLQYVPFAAMRLPASGDAPRTVPLIVDHEIISLPSASLLTALRRETAQRAPATGTVAVVGDPVYRSGDPRLRSVSDGVGDSGIHAHVPNMVNSFNTLPFAEAEMRTILDLVPEDQRLEAAGFEANRELVMSGALGDYRIVHFVTHGLVNTRHPDLSGIVLSLFGPDGRPRDGFLRAHEIYNLNLPAELVVLSACQTALGQEVRGEGLIGLTQGLMYAGAARVMVSLWDVSDPSTAELMARFYRSVLLEGLRPAAALRKAQVSMLREPRWAAPYYWAPFILQGDWM